MSINSYILFLNQTSKGIDKVVKKSILKNKSKILGIIRNRLFQTGTDGLGKKISPSYSAFTIEKKKNKRPRQRTSHVTLRDTGNFYKSMILEVIGNEIFVNSTAFVYPLLTQKYGNNILGLTKSEIEFIIDAFIEPDVNEYLNRFKGDIQIEI